MNNSTVFRTAVIILLLTNISFTVYFSNKASDNHCSWENTSTKQQDPLKVSFPQGLDEAVITEIFFSISESYSAKNFEKLLSLLDPDMVNKLGKESILNEFNKIYNIFGPITEGFFSSIYPIGTTDKKLYKIGYDVGLSEGSRVGQHAILSVTVQLDNNRYRIKGIFLNSPTHQEE